MGNPVKQDRTLAPLSSSTQLALTHAPSGYTRLDADQMLLRVAPSSSLVPGGLGVPFEQPCRLGPWRRPARRARLVHLELQRIQVHRFQIPLALGKTHSQARAMRDHPSPVLRGRAGLPGPTVSTPPVTSASRRRA